MFKGAVFVFLGACSFGILSTFVKLAYTDGFTLGEVTGIQAFLGVLILWSLYLVSRSVYRKKSTVESDVKTPAWKVILAGCSTGLVSIFYYKCVSLLPASIAIILLMQFVWIGVLLEAMLFRKRPSKQQIFAVITVLLGTCFASGLLDAEINQLSLAGIGFGLLAALAYSFFILINGRVGNDLPSIKKSAWMITGACTLIFIIFPPAFFFNGVLFSGLIKWGIILAVFVTVIPPLFLSLIPI